jgi:hypothetical protein
MVTWMSATIAASHSNRFVNWVHPFRWPEFPTESDIRAESNASPLFIFANANVDTPNAVRSCIGRMAERVSTVPTEIAPSRRESANCVSPLNGGFSRLMLEKHAEHLYNLHKFWLTITSK